MVGTTVSHYKILERLGGGGMGVVYKAEDTRLKRTVALKFLPPDLTRDPGAKERFIHEAQAASALQHTNICVVHDIDETADGQMFLCMEFLEGETLKKVIEQGPLKIEKAIDIALQVARGLMKAHEHSIVHRDIKPANIMVTADGVAKIVDFGLAKLIGRTMLTRTGSTLGTAAYMSPEQARGEAVDHRSDIWSLGVVLYEMLTGKRPFEAEYENALFYSILNAEPEPLTGLRTGIPMDLEGTVAKAMAKAPSDRYQHLDDMQVDLQKVLRGLEGTETGKPHPAAPIRKRSRKIAIGAAAFLVLGAALLLTKSALFEDAFPQEPITVAVISFENQTGETSYDYLSRAIPNLLITSLERSRYLKVVTWERMLDVLRQMGRTNVSSIDKEMGFELSHHEGITALVVGSFVKAGDTFVTDVKVLDAETKELLETASARGSGAQSILDHQIDDLSKSIARGVGLSHRRIAATSEPIAEVTTASIEAYNYYLRARDEFDKIYYDQAILFLRKALALDSSFAMAHLLLAQSYGGLGNTREQAAALRRAMEFSAKAGEKDRLVIQAAYARGIERNVVRQREIFQELATRFPGEKRFHVNLADLLRGDQRLAEAHTEISAALRLDPDFAPAVNELAYLYADEGQYSRAIECFARYAALSPGDANPFDSMGEIATRMGQLDRSLAYYLKAIAVKPDFWQSYISVAYVKALQERYDEAFEYLRRMIEISPHATVKAQGEYWRAWILAEVGQPRAAKKVLSTIMPDSTGPSEPFTATGYWGLTSFIDWDIGALDRSREDLRHLQDVSGFGTLFPVSVKIRLLAWFGLMDVAAGNLDSARVRLTAINALMPDVEPRWRNEAECISRLLAGRLLVAEDSLAQAIGVLKSIRVAAPTAFLSVNLTIYNAPLMHDDLAQAYVRRGDTDSAIAEYRRLLTIDSTDQDRRLIHPRYHLRIAMLYEQKGERDRAVAEYRRFLELWKNAETDRPELALARTHLARLKGRNR